MGKRGRISAEERARIVTVESSRCSRCKEEKPADQFNAHRGNTTGLQSWCRDCSATAKDAGTGWSGRSREELFNEITILKQELEKAVRRARLAEEKLRLPKEYAALEPGQVLSRTIADEIADQIQDVLADVLYKGRFPDRVQKQNRIIADLRTSNHQLKEENARLSKSLDAINGFLSDAKKGR